MAGKMREDPSDPYLLCQIRLEQRLVPTERQEVDYAVDVSAEQGLFHFGRIHSIFERNETIFLRHCDLDRDETQELGKPLSSTES